MNKQFKYSVLAIIVVVFSTGLFFTFKFITGEDKVKKEKIELALEKMEKDLLYELKEKKEKLLKLPSRIVNEI